MPELSLAQHAAQVASAQRTRARLTRWVLLFFKLVFVIGGSAVAAIALESEFPATGATPAQVIGIIASGSVAIGMMIVLVFERDTDKELLIAQEGLEVAQRSESLELVLELQDDHSRAANLYNALLQMRRAIERACLTGAIWEEDIVDRMLSMAARNLRVALGFNQGDTWTICVYRPVRVRGSPTVLRCAAHDRAIPCDKANAREWKEGDGVVGLAYLRRKAVVIADMQDPKVKRLLSANSFSRSHDAQRYRSVAAVPVRVDDDAEPSAIVVASSDVPGHFSEDELGVTGVEGVTAFSRMVELLEAIRRRVPEPRAPSRRKQKA